MFPENSTTTFIDPHLEAAVQHLHILAQVVFFNESQPSIIRLSELPRSSGVCASIMCSCNSISRDRHTRWKNENG